GAQRTTSRRDAGSVSRVQRGVHVELWTRPQSRRPDRRGDPAGAHAPTARARGGRGRRPARADAADRRPALRTQDRRRLDRSARRTGPRPLEQQPDQGRRCHPHPHARHRASRPYQMQAAIAAVHDEAPSADETDWPQILALYDVLERISPGPVVTLNRAVALAMVNGPRAGLALLGTLDLDERM